MHLLNLVNERGLTPKWVALTEGGEYHSPCPSCGGTDRFIIQPNKQMKNCMGYYFCRQCGVKGDSIQFCLDYLDFTNFKEAADYAKANLPNLGHNIFTKKNTPDFLAVLNKPSKIWDQQASKIVQEAHDCILLQNDILQNLNNRGLPIDVIKKNKIGWLPENKNFEGHEWGLEKEKVWFPAGLLIPTIEQDGSIIRLKIRRKDWRMGDELPKYIAISGSMKGFNIIGNKKNHVVIIVESELDAYALHHIVGNFAVIIAIGGSIKNPDRVTGYLAQNKPFLLICHDNDDAGINMLHKWKDLYSHAQPCPTPIGKDIGEAIQQGFDIRDWILKILVKFWDKEDQDLIYWFLDYIHKSRKKHNINEIFVNTEQEIMLGHNSPRAKTRELQNGLKLVKDTLDEYLKKING